MKNSFFSRFTPKEPKFFPLLKQLSEVLCEASVVLTESLQHDSPTERADYYKKIKELEHEGDKLTHRIFDELGTTFITPFDREDIHDLASCMDDVIDGINSCAKRISIYNPRPISENGKELSRLIQEEATYICKAMDELETFRKKPTLLREYCSRLHESRIRQMTYMNSLSPSYLKKKRIALNLSKLKKSCMNWRKQPMPQSM